MGKLFDVTVLETHLRSIRRIVVADSQEQAEAIAIGQEDGDYVELADNFCECTGDKEVDECEQVTEEGGIREVLEQWPDLCQCIDCSAFGTIESGSGCDCHAKEGVSQDA